MATRSGKRLLTLADLAAEFDLPPETVRTALYSFAAGTPYTVLGRWLGVPADVLSRLRERCPYFVERRLLEEDFIARHTSEFDASTRHATGCDDGLLEQVRVLKKAGVGREDARNYLQMGREFSVYWRRAAQGR